MKISVFFPAWNEEANIKASIQRANDVFKNFEDYEILVINDGSTDKTAEVVLSLNNPKVRLINHSKNLGYGNVIKTAFKNVNFPYTFFTDADLQFDLEEIKKLTEYPDYDVVIGYRHDRKDSRTRKFYASIWNWIIRVLFDLRIEDIDCAFKLLKSNLIKDLDLNSRTGMISAEILIKLRDMGTSIKEIPVTHFPRKDGKSTGASFRVIKTSIEDCLGFFYISGYANKFFEKFFKYIFIGFLNTLITLSLFILLKKYFPEYLAFISAYMLGVINGFVCNKLWTFKNNTN